MSILRKARYLLPNGYVLTTWEYLENRIEIFLVDVEKYHSKIGKYIKEANQLASRYRIEYEAAKAVAIAKHIAEIPDRYRSTFMMELFKEEQETIFIAYIVKQGIDGLLNIQHSKLKETQEGTLNRGNNRTSETE